MKNSIVIMSHYGYRLYDKNIRKYLEGDCLDFSHNVYLYNITRRVSKVLNLNEWGLDNGLEYRYMCGNDSNCSKIDRELKDIDIEFFFWFTGYKLDHQAEIPFQIDRDKRYMFPRVFDIDLFYQGAIVEFDWEVIQYKDKQSIFDSLMNNKKDITTFGHFKPEYKITYTELTPKERHIDYDHDDQGKINYYMNILTLKFYNNHFEYILYERTKIEFLDILASIGALFSTIKFFFDLVFSYYSKSFNNYKTLEKILSSPKDHFKKIEINSEYKDSINGSTDGENNDLMKDIDKKDLLINKSSDENESENEIKYDINNKNIDEDNPIVLDKLPFIDFFYNNIYCKCCKKRRNQELINSLNEISYKYLSIEALLYNQLKLEGLFNDYNWNNPSLKNVLNNKMIKELKNI